MSGTARTSNPGTSRDPEQKHTGRKERARRQWGRYVAGVRSRAGRAVVHVRRGSPETTPLSLLR